MQTFNIKIQTARDSIVIIEFFATSKLVALAYASSFCLETGSTVLGVI